MIRLQYISLATKDGIDVWSWFGDYDIAVVDLGTGICYQGHCHEGSKSVMDEVEDFIG